ncbi:MAG TPA: twin-arginine translocation signal domain-containing protein [Puia sp.]|nr:twin-arginine translocation signal domain-containing protein [Puia sp.]
MKNNRREFLKFSGLAGLGMAGGIMKGVAADFPLSDYPKTMNKKNPNDFNDEELSMIGLYGPWAASLTANKLPSFSFRNSEWTNIESWCPVASQRVKDRMSIPDIGGLPEVRVIKEIEFDGLLIQELQWQLPYGRPTEATLLKPLHTNRPLPGVLAFHDHGGNKYFGKRKITKTENTLHPLLVAHQKEYYSGLAWANELAKKGYVVLVPDAFAFGSRRVMLQDVPKSLRKGLNDDDPENSDNITAYNSWASDHEHIMAKSLFSAGTSWPAMFFAEDQKALDILCSLKDVDAKRVGCAGLSGGGLRTVFMGGLDPRIQCAISVGFMTTWKDFLLYKSVTHTWMVYVPLLPRELNFPEILGLRIPLPTLILNDKEDELYSPEEMKEADRILAELYHKAGADDRYKCSYYPGPHKFDESMQAEAFSWFDRWLKR